MDWSLLGYISVTLSALVGAVWSLGLLIAKQFTVIKKSLYDVKDQIIDKLEYHEKHDDSRFEAVRKDIWEIRLRNAALDGSYRGKSNLTQDK